MSITALTENKLFQIKRFDTNEPYKIGYNGVLDIYQSSDGDTVIKYEIDGLIYRSNYVEPNKSKDDYSYVEYTEFVRKDNSDLYSLNRSNLGTFIETKDSRTNQKKYFNSPDSLKNTYKKRIKKSGYLGGLYPNVKNIYLGDTVVEIPNLSFEKFINKKIFKNDKYIGFISKPEVKSEILIERDEISVFERHQRLSEINNLSELETYRNGYYKIVNTI